MLFKTTSEDCDRKAGKPRELPSKYPLTVHLRIAVQLTFMLCFLRFPAIAQTIAIKDLPRLVASVREIGERDSVGYTARSFQSWYIDTQEGSYAASRKDDNGSGLVWLYAPRTEIARISWQGGEPSSEVTNRRFIVFIDGCSYERRQNVLTSWQIVPGDSLHLEAIDVGDYYAWMGGTRIRSIVFFPDSSLLLCTESSGGDMCDMYGHFRFLRETRFGDFSIFYQEMWDSDSRKEVKFDLDRLISGQYSVVRDVHYLTSIWSDSTLLCPDLRPDSARADVIDLWNLAVDYFKLDTARIRR